MPTLELLWWLWLFVSLVGFAVLELAALTNSRPGDTLSESLRRWFKVEDDGKWARTEKILLGLLLIFAGVGVWLPGHIFGWWP